MSEKTDYYEKHKCDDISDCSDCEKSDYLSEYRHFFEVNSAADPDYLAIRVLTSTVLENELTGEIFSYATQYLDHKECPVGLVTPLCRAILDSSTKACVKDPQCLKVTKDGRRSYHSLRVMNNVVTQIHVACHERLDNALAASIPHPRILPLVGISASRNGVRRMEDRHVVIDDLNYLCDIESPEPAGFYAVYDGHCGPLAAVYSAAHLHILFAKHPTYFSNPMNALRHAFLTTDKQFFDSKLSGGSTATVCHIRGKEMLLGWVGDSRAMIVKSGAILPLVNSHKPDRTDEHMRIRKMGGYISFHGTIWRVNDILSVSRAIGGVGLKPFVCPEPEILSLTLDGNEDFVVIATDGLWDYAADEVITKEIYQLLINNPDDLKKVADRVVQVAKSNFSTDNISVLVVVLKDPHKIAEQARRIEKIYTVTMDSSFDNSSYNAQGNLFDVTAIQDMAFPKDGILFDLADGMKQQQNGTVAEAVDPEDSFHPEGFTNGKTLCEPVVEDEDLGPETDVDAIDDIHLSPSMEEARALVGGLNLSDRFDEDAELEAATEAEGADARPPAREDTPTPPIDTGLETNSGALDNVADSAEESEDEWNYIKGENKGDPVTPQHIRLPEAQEPEILALDGADLEENLDDTMNSPLNPEAPPFVPVSPVHGGRPDIPSILSNFINDEVVSQSPQKPVPMDDINVPEPNEFEIEVSTRLSDLGNADDVDYMNGHSNNSALSSQENLKEALHGNEKELENYNDDEPVDRPISSNDDYVDQAEFDRVQKDTTDFCDIQVKYPPYSNETCQDEGMNELYEHLKNKESDPMNRSFYQEKDEDTCEIRNNPFDLNAVQQLPSNSDDEYDDEQPQPDNSIPTFGINPFAGEVTSSEINAAISTIENVVIDESGLFDSTEYSKSESPIAIEKADIELPEQSEEVLSPVSDNVSQLTEPSEHEHETMEMPRSISPALQEHVEEPVIEPEVAHCEFAPPNVVEPERKSPFMEETLDIHKEAESELISQSPTPIVEPSNDFYPTSTSPDIVLDAYQSQQSDLLENIESSIPCDATSPIPNIPSPVPTDNAGSDDFILQDKNEDIPYSDSTLIDTHIETTVIADDDEILIKQMDDTQEFIETENLIEKQSFVELAESNVAENIIEPVSNTTNGFYDDEFCKLSEKTLDEPLVEMKPAVENEESLPEETNIISDNILEIEPVINNMIPDNYENASQVINELVIDNEIKSDSIVEIENIDIPAEAEVPIDVPVEEIITSTVDDILECEKISPVEETVLCPEIETITSPTKELESQVIEPKLIEPEVMQEPIITQVENEINVEKSDINNLVDVTPVLAVTAGAAIAGAVIAGAATLVKDDEKKPTKSKPSTPLAKKTTATKSAASPTKPALSPTKAAVSPTKAAIPRVSSSTAKKPTTINIKPTTASPKAPAKLSKPPTAATSPTKPAPIRLSTATTTAAPKPRPATATTKAPVEKKPLTNGDVKREPIKRPVPGAITKTTATKTATAAPAPKPATATVTRTSTTGTRPITAPARTATATARPLTAAAKTTTAAPKPRPTPTPPTRSTAAKPAALSAGKTSITDKITKDTTNKQISASRPTPAPRTGLAPKPSDAKTNKTKTTTTTTTKSTNPVPIKRPTTNTTTKTTVTKTTKTSTKVIGKTIEVVQQNGSHDKSTKEELIEQEQHCVNGSMLITDIPLKAEITQHEDLKNSYSYY